MKTIELTLDDNRAAPLMMKVDHHKKVEVPVPVTAEGEPQKAIDLKKIWDLLPALIPLIITLITGGGFSPLMIPIILQIIAQIFGVPVEEAQRLLSENLAVHASTNPPVPASEAPPA